MKCFRSAATALVALAAASWAVAADPAITGEVKVPRDRLVRLKAEGVEAKAGIYWKVYPSKGVDKADAPKGRLQFVAPPGTYEVTLLVIRQADGEIDIAEATATVTVGDAGPTPPPTPDPTPDPDKTAARVTVVVVEETGGRTPSHGKVIYDRPTRDWLKAGRHEFELLEVSDPEYGRVGYKPFVDKVGLPAVLVFDADAKGPTAPLLAFRLPATGDELSAEIRKAVRK